MSSNEYSDYERIALFLKRVEKLRNNSLNREGKLRNISTRAGFDTKHGFRYEILGADNEPINMESFEALVTVFRLIYMRKEPTNIERVFDVVYNSLAPDQRSDIQHFKENWRRALDEESHLIDADNRNIKIDRVLENWLHGEVFHSDKAKREFLRNWGKPLEGEVVIIVRFLSIYIFWLEDFIRQGMMENRFILSHTIPTSRPARQES